MCGQGAKKNGDGDVKQGSGVCGLGLYACVHTCTHAPTHPHVYARVRVRAVLQQMCGLGGRCVGVRSTARETTVW